MATLAPVTANSLQGQVDQLTKRFIGVRKSGSVFEGQERRTRDYLFTALADVYDFGEAVYNIKPQPGTSIFRTFFAEMTKQNPKLPVAYNAKCQENPYIGLVKLAFSGSSASSQSQYATVLEYAHHEGKKPADLIAWLEEKDDQDRSGIERRRSEALEAKGSRQRGRNNQARKDKLANATTKLNAMPASAAVALPAGLVAPEGFAIVLAKIDAANNASIVEIVESAAEKVDPVLLRLVAPKPVDRSDEPLHSLIRAVDLIISTTPAKPGKPRDLLVRNTLSHDLPRAVVQAISETYSFPGAVMDIEGHIPGLPIDDAFVLTADDAALLISLADSYRGWTVDETGRITADQLANPIQMTKLANAGNYRVANPGKSQDKPIEIKPDTAAQVVAYLDRERSAHTEKMKKAKQKQPFPPCIDLQIDGNFLTAKLATSIISVTIADTSAEAELDERTLGVQDLASLMSTLKEHEAQAEGWLLDNQVDDAGIVVEAWFDNDNLRVVLPTKTGNAYNQVCEALTL